MDEKTTLYDSKSDVCDWRDIIDLFCKFSEKLELAANEPSREFLTKRLEFLHEEVQELEDATLLHDDVESVDGAADVAFVAITQLYHIFRLAGFSPSTAQVKTRCALIEVGKSNMTKTVPTENMKKITKPEGWEAPELGRLFMTEEEIRKENSDDMDGNDG